MNDDPPVAIPSQPDDGKFKALAELREFSKYMTEQGHIWFQIILRLTLANFVACGAIVYTLPGRIGIYFSMFAIFLISMGAFLTCRRFSRSHMSIHGVHDLSLREWFMALEALYPGINKEMRQKILGQPGTKSPPLTTRGADLFLDHANLFPILLCVLYLVASWLCPSIVQPMK